MTIQPFNGAYFLLLLLIGLLTAAITHSFSGRPEADRERVIYTISACNILFFVLYKGLLSQDGDFLEVSHMEKFNWLNELPIQLCNINLFLIPIGLKRRDRALMGFSFFVAPLGALAAITCPEPAFSGYSVLLSRILGFYGTHALLIVSGLSLATLGFYRPEKRDFSGIYAAASVMGVCIHLINFLLRKGLCPQANYFYTYPTDIAILHLFWKLIPVPLLYLLPAFGILTVYMLLVCGVLRLLDHVKEQRAIRWAI